MKREEASKAMKLSGLSPWLVGKMSISIAALLLTPAMSGSAHAFGGLWSSQAAQVRQSAAEILFVDNPGPTVTVIVRIRYEGPAQQFAWVIPVRGMPAIGVSSSTVFERLDLATAPEYWVEVEAAGTCVAQDDRDAGGAPGDPGLGVPPAMPIERGSIGSYEYMFVAADPALDDPAAPAIDWLSSNGYELSERAAELLGAYLADGLDLLAFKLASDADAGAIRPVVLTYESERPVIPIRPAAVAAQDDMAIKVWVVGPSQAVPRNYGSLVINDALIDWLSGQTYPAGTLPSGGAGPFGLSVQRPSNYDAVVSAAADEADGHGFATELAAPASQFRDKLWSTVDAETFATVSAQSYEDGLDAILAAAGHYGSWDGFLDAVQGATALPSGVTLEEFARDPEQHRGVAAVDTARFLQLLDEHVVQPVADTAAMLNEAPYLTRLYSTISANEMTLDPAFDYNFDLAQVSNVHIARQRIECGPEVNREDAPWRIELPQGGVIAGEGGGWPLAQGSMPANLKVVMLGASGSGTVVEDNSAEIRRKLLELGGDSGGGSTLYRPPQIGLLIGGSQTVNPPPDPVDAGADAGAGRVESAGDDGCSVAHAGAGHGNALALLMCAAAGMLALRRRRARVGVCLLLLLACSDPQVPVEAEGGAALPEGHLTPEQLRDPETCKGCHPIHYREWSASMHAYAAKDPVFLAMNRRGQRETHGELGDFCVKCHAPMAVIDGLTTDGLDLPQLPDGDRGVSCYFCHNVTRIDGDHNAQLSLADDTVMRGPIANPTDAHAHGSEYSEMFEDTRPASSALCGGCHDIVTPKGVHLERTFQEYLGGIFSKSADGQPPAFDSCVGCHMPPRDGFAAAVPGSPLREVHEHLWPGIDVALTDFPGRDALRSAVEDCELGKSVAFFTLEVTPPDLFSFQIETGAGHNQPSGAAQDRRMWLEFLAYDESGELLPEVSSGDITDGEIEEQPEDHPEHDPRLLMFRDRIYDAQGKPVHMFWEAERSPAYPDGYTSNTLPVATTTYIEGKNAVLKQYRARGPDGGLPARVTARLRIRPIGIDVLQDLVDSGDLDPAIVAQMPTLTFGAQIQWTQADGVAKTVRAELKSDCTTYRCLLDPGSQECD
jgi:hypothetical protein